jgi:APA family basic amino acid/polyamine antiporter
MPKPANTQPVLKRSVGLVLFVLYGVGNIIGAGIYVLVGKVASAFILLLSAWTELRGFF